MTLEQGTIAVITARKAGSKGEPVVSPTHRPPQISPDAILSAAQGFLNLGAEDANNAGQVAPFQRNVVALGEEFDLPRLQREARTILKEELPELSRMGEPARVIDRIIDFLGMESLQAQEAEELRKAS